VQSPSHRREATYKRSFFWSIISAASGRRGKWITLLVWIAAIASLSQFASKLGDVEENDSAAWLPESAESLKVDQMLDSFITDETTDAVIVYHRDGGLTASDQATIEADRAQFGQTYGAENISPAITSGDGLAAIYSVTMPDMEDDEETDAVDAMRVVTSSHNDGLVSKVTGPAGFNRDFNNAFSGMDSKLLLATAGVVAILLLLTYRSPILWILPLLSVAFADQGAMAVIYFLAKHANLTVNAQSSGILPVLVFGVGTDYALLLLARYREELHQHNDHHMALRVALHRAGPAILASSATVVIGMLCLLGADLSSNKSLGPVGAIGIVLALAAMLTLLPAILAIIGRRVFWPFTPKPGTDTREDSRFWRGIGTRIARRPRPVWIATVIILGAMALGLTQINPNLSTEDSFRNPPDSIQGQALLAQSFAAGSSQPNTVVANTSEAAAVQQAISDTPGIEAVTTSGAYGDQTVFDVTLSAEPGSKSAYDAIDKLRQNVHAIPNANALVGGSDAEGLDIERANSRDQKVVIPAVLAVVFIVLCLLLRSIVAPLMLIATVILSFAAALGASVLVFEHVFNYGGIDPSLPLLGFVFLVALGIDYNIFLMSRVHEEAAKHGTREGMIKGIAVTGGVITSAGLVLAATFSVLTVMPLVQMVEIGFLVAFGVLLDTIVVRSILVPALTFHAGRRIWWPSRLSRTYFPVPEPVRQSADDRSRVRV
jgi:RND superfamily putative drug exporter